MVFPGCLEPFDWLGAVSYTHLDVYKRQAKYWPPVGRVDNVYGDRNLTCSCPPIEAYSEE